MPEKMNASHFKLLYKITRGNKYRKLTCVTSYKNIFLYPRIIE